VSGCRRGTLSVPKTLLWYDAGVVRCDGGGGGDREVVGGDAVDDVADADVAHHVGHGGGGCGDGDDEADDADELHRHHLARLGEEPLEVRRHLPQARARPHPVARDCTSG
jgi:hypothetical protein